MREIISELLKHTAKSLLDGEALKTNLKEKQNEAP